MKELGLQTIRVADIDVVDRLRHVDENHAQMLAQNIKETGLRSPIEVRVNKKGDRFTLIAGGHRLKATQINEMVEIKAFVFEATDDEARLYEIDENLIRHDLNPLDRAVFMAERKRLYEALHPETAAGVAGAETLFYLDPPYWGCEKDYGKAMFERADFERLATILSVLKGHFILSLNDVPDVRAIFSQFQIEGVDTSYSISGTPTGRGVFKEVLIMGGGGGF